MTTEQLILDHIRDLDKYINREDNRRTEPGQALCELMMAKSKALIALATITQNHRFM